MGGRVDCNSCARFWGSLSIRSLIVFTDPPLDVLVEDLTDLLSPSSTIFSFEIDVVLVVKPETGSIEGFVYQLGH
jgi:hypothetical protein